MGAVATIKNAANGDMEGALDPFGHISGLTGQAGADAALAGAQLQAQTSREALDYTKERDALQRSDLQPFVQWGSNAMPFYAAMLNPQVQANYLENNPMFKAAIDKSNTGFKNTLGFQGKRGDLQNAITQNYMATGNQYVQQAMNNLWNPITLGQNSAAGQAANTGQNTNAVNNLLTGIGNAQAAGGIGAANAYAQGGANAVGIAGLVGSLLQGGGAAAACDERLKRDIQPIGIDPADGIIVCLFRYIGHAAWYLGKMAQDIAKINPCGVFERNGALFVSSQYAPVRVG